MKNLGEKFKLFSEHFQSISVSSCEALATFAAYASYPALDCLSQNFVQCGQAIMYVHILSYIIKKVLPVYNFFSHLVVASKSLMAWPHWTKFCERQSRAG